MNLLRNFSDPSLQFPVKQSSLCLYIGPMEVVSIFATPLLSAAFKSLLDRLNSSELLNFEKKVVAELQNWRSLLPKIIALLEVAEEKKVTDRVLKLWLADLKGLANDMEDVIAKFEVVDTKTCDLIAKRKANSRQVRKLVSSLVKGLRFRFDRETASKVKDISKRLQNFEIETRALGTITMGVEDGERSNKVGLRRSPTSSLLECYVCGREEDKEAVRQMLLNDEGSGDGDSIIPIVGDGGLGKTTLARLVYNDEKLEGSFQLKAWVCVSDDFDPHWITQTILHQVTQENCDLQDLSLLQEKLKRKLSGQKFLLVLDDVWNLNYCHWDMLQILFKAGASGSKIIVTTRDKDVAKTMKGNEKNFHNIGLLPDDACLSLLARHALGTENFEAHSDLKGIGEEIVRKCKRLPLSVKIIGGQLRGKSCCEEWKHVLNSQIWDLPEDEGGILPSRN